jgi:hypothetical protein
MFGERDGRSRCEGGRKWKRRPEGRPKRKMMMVDRGPNYLPDAMNSGCKMATCFGARLKTGY